MSGGGAAPAAAPPSRGGVTRKKKEVSSGVTAESDPRVRDGTILALKELVDSKPGWSIGRNKADDSEYYIRAVEPERRRADGGESYLNVGIGLVVVVPHGFPATAPYLCLNPIIVHPHVDDFYGHYCNENFNSYSWHKYACSGAQFAKAIVQAIYELDDKDINWNSVYRFHGQEETYKRDDGVSQSKDKKPFDKKPPTSADHKSFKPR